MTRIFLKARKARTDKVCVHFRSQKFMLVFAGLLAGFAATLAPERAHAQDFASEKYICAGDPSLNDPDTCTEIQFVGAGQPVFYVFRVTNPAFSGVQLITLQEDNQGTIDPNDPWPDGFTPGAIACHNQLGVPVAITGADVGSFLVQQGDTVTCTVEGSFSDDVIGADITNQANVISGLNVSPVDATVHVNSISPLGTDLSVTKSVSPPSIDVSLGAVIVEYTVTIQNTGQTVDVGDWFVLHDNLRLLPNSVPLFATLDTTPGSFSCSAIPATTDCLDPSGPTPTPAGQRLIGTMAPVSMFDWGFATGDGRIDAGATITLTWKVKIEQLNGLSCIIQLNADGLENRAFFTLTNANGTVRYDIDNTNNTASTPLAVTTGNTTIDPNCGQGQMKIEKAEVVPSSSTNAVAWGGNVAYDITIKNTSVPAQSITISGGDLKDYVVNGIGTPPFTRTFVSWSCTPVGLTPAAVCSGVNGSGSPFTYSYYGQSDLGWQSNSGSDLTLAQDDEVIIRVEFNYADPDCDTVPNVNPKPVKNVGVITYMATALGALNVSPQNVQYTQTATATTFMEPQKTCKFVVKKRLLSGGPKLKFGVPMVYIVRFINNDASRTIGTVMDSARIADPVYGTPLPFGAQWKCTTTTGVTGYTPSGSVSVTSGQAIYTSSPSQGAPVMEQSHVSFPKNSTLRCRVEITVERPAFGNSRCSAEEVDFENMGLMDTTHPYNTNVPWPPSGAYPGAASNPQPQNRNWATVRTPLPKCYDVIINKAASANGVSPAWTWTPGGPAIDYTIKVTNTADNGALTGTGGTASSWNGLMIRDGIASPYNTNLVDPGNIAPLAPICVASGWCQPFKPPALGPAVQPPLIAGVLNLPAGASGDWNLTLNSPFTTGKEIHNCATARPRGKMKGSGWYSNYDPADPPRSCLDVPVLETTELSVTKVVVNQTGSPITIPGLSFGVDVSCSPYPLPPTSSTLTTGGISLANGASTSSSPWVVSNVPVADQCTVTETSLPPAPSVACSVNGVPGTTYWDTIITPTPIQMSATGQNAVQVINALRCEAPPEPPCDCDEGDCLIPLTDTFCITWQMLCCLFTLFLLFWILAEVRGIAARRG